MVLRWRSVHTANSTVWFADCRVQSSILSVHEHHAHPSYTHIFEHGTDAQTLILTDLRACSQNLMQVHRTSGGYSDIRYTHHIYVWMEGGQEVRGTDRCVKVHFRFVTGQQSVTQWMEGAKKSWFPRYVSPYQRIEFWFENFRNKYRIFTLVLARGPISLAHKTKALKMIFSK